MQQTTAASKLPSRDRGLIHLGTLFNR